MNADGAAGLDVTLAAALAPAWLGPTTGALVILGTALVLLALLALFWPQPAIAAPQHATAAPQPTTTGTKPAPLAAPATWPPVLHHQPVLSRH